MAERIILEEKSYKTVCREGNILIKSFVPSHPKSNVYNEAYIHSCVEEAGIPVPKIISVTPSEDGGFAIAMEFIEGKTLQQMMAETPRKRTNTLSALSTSSLRSAPTAHPSSAIPATK